MTIKYQEIKNEALAILNSANDPEQQHQLLNRFVERIKLGERLEYKHGDGGMMLHFIYDNFPGILSNDLFNDIIKLVHPVDVVEIMLSIMQKIPVHEISVHMSLISSAVDYFAAHSDPFKTYHSFFRQTSFDEFIEAKCLTLALEVENIDYTTRAETVLALFKEVLTEELQYADLPVRSIYFLEQLQRMGSNSPFAQQCTEQIPMIMCDVGVAKALIGNHHLAEIIEAFSKYYDIRKAIIDETDTRDAYIDIIERQIKAGEISLAYETVCALQDHELSDIVYNAAIDSKNFKMAYDIATKLNDLTQLDKTYHICLTEGQYYIAISAAVALQNRHFVSKAFKTFLQAGEIEQFRSIIIKVEETEYLPEILDIFFAQSEDAQDKCRKECSHDTFLEKPDREKFLTLALESGYGHLLKKILNINPESKLSLDQAIKAINILPDSSKAEVLDKHIQPNSLQKLFELAIFNDLQHVCEFIIKHRANDIIIEDEETLEDLYKLIDNKVLGDFLVKKPPNVKMLNKFFELGGRIDDVESTQMLLDGLIELSVRGFGIKELLNAGYDKVVRYLLLELTGEEIHVQNVKDLEDNFGNISVLRCKMFLCMAEPLLFADADQPTYHKNMHDFKLCKLFFDFAKDNAGCKDRFTDMVNGLALTLVCSMHDLANNDDMQAKKPLLEELLGMVRRYADKITGINDYNQDDLSKIKEAIKSGDLDKFAVIAREIECDTNINFASKLLVSFCSQEEPEETKTISKAKAIGAIKTLQDHEDASKISRVLHTLGTPEATSELCAKYICQHADPEVILQCLGDALLLNH